MKITKTQLQNLIKETIQKEVLHQKLHEQHSDILNVRSVREFLSIWTEVSSDEGIDILDAKDAAQAWYELMGDKLSGVETNKLVEMLTKMGAFEHDDPDAFKMKNGKAPPESML